MNTRLFFNITIAMIVLMSTACAVSETSSTDSSSSVDTGDGVSLSYVGSDQCRTCHRTIHDTWTITRHTKKVTLPSASSPGVVCDSDYDGTNDFKEGITLGNTDNSTAFANYYAAGTAPILSYDTDTSTYKIQIGNVTYDVDYLLGGDGWKQRYMTISGNSLYIFPIQYNMESNEWVAYHIDDWYVKDGDTQSTNPIYDTGQTHVSEGNTADSWDRRCTACHATGMTAIAFNDDKEYVSTYKEFNVGCEACHGPGSQHVALGGGDGVEIVNPSTLGFDRAQEVCGTCHGRGASVGTVGTGDDEKTMGFPWNDGPYIPGDVLADFYTQTTAASKFWGLASTRSKSHHQQYLDQLGTMPGLNCFDCHSAHGSGYRHDTKLNAQDNTLCLSCHGEGGVAESDWATDGDISDHTFHAVDAMDKTKPGAGNGSQCIACHAPKVAKSAINYDISTHNFRVIYPEQSAKLVDAGDTAIPNACMNGICHTANDQSDTDWDKDTDADLTQATACINGDAGCPDATFTGFFSGNNIPPIASTGGTSTTSTVADGAVTLDGSRSFDPNASAITYSWVQTAGPAVTLSDATAESPTFTPATAGIYTFSLIVNDGTDDSNEVTVTITISS